jgi:hypothetical protein
MTRRTFLLSFVAALFGRAKPKPDEGYEFTASYIAAPLTRGEGTYVWCVCWPDLAPMDLAPMPIGPQRFTTTVLADMRRKTSYRSKGKPWSVKRSVP